MENKPDKEQELLHAVNEIAESIHHLRNTAYYHYATLVKQVMQNKITGEMNIELIMDCIWQPLTIIELNEAQV